MRSELDALRRTPVGRRAMLRYMGYAAVVGGSGILAACRKDVTSGGTSPIPSASASVRPAIGEEPGTLKAYEWAGFEVKPIWKSYVAEGFTEPKFSFFTNTEQALAKTAGGYTWDISHPEVGYIQDYVNLGAIQPWDTTLIPNFPQLSPLLQATGQLDGQQYEIVTDWGYSGVIARSDHVDVSDDSYSILFDDRYAGHISWFDTPWILQQAGLVLGVESDVFDMTSEDLQRCKEYCIDKKKNLYNIWVNFTEMWDDVRQGNVWAAYSWPDTFVVLKDEVPVEYIRPKEGTLSWAEGLVLNTDTENYLHAHEFADTWTSPEVGLWLLSTYGYGHSNLEIDLDQIDPEVVQAFGLEDPETNLAEPASLFDRYQPQRDAYNRAWDEVKAG